MILRSLTYSAYQWNVTHFDGKGILISKRRGCTFEELAFTPSQTSLTEIELYCLKHGHRPQSATAVTSTTRREYESRAGHLICRSRKARSSRLDVQVSLPDALVPCMGIRTMNVDFVVEFGPCLGPSAVILLQIYSEENGPSGSGSWDLALKALPGTLVSLLD